MDNAVEIKERIQKWDILKFVLIFLVVLGHVAEFYIGDSYNIRALWTWIYSFHMPLFIFVTGLFSKKNVNEKRYSKILSYFFIYIVSKVLLMFCGLADGKGFAFSLLTERGLPWYALAILVFSLVTIVLKRFPKLYVFLFAILLACAAGYDNSLGDFLALSRIIVYYPFFFAGYCLDGKKIVQFLSEIYVKVGAAVFFVVYSIIFFWKLDAITIVRPLFSGRNPFSTLGDYAEYGFFLRLGYYVVVFLFCASVIALIPNRLDKKGYIARLGTRTLQVYILHFCFVYFMNGFLDMEAIYDNTSYYMMIPVSLLLTLFCSMKFWEKPLQFLINPEMWHFKKQESKDKEGV